LSAELGVRGAAVRRRRVGVAVAAATLLVACDATRSGTVDFRDAAAGAFVAVDDAGRTVRLSAAAERIVSLLPGATETLLEMGAGERLVARTDHDADPRLAHLPSIGGGLTPSLEKLASLQPDLVIVWEEAGTARLRPRLEALGIAVFAARTQDTTAIFANIERFGRLTGLEASADSLAAALRHQLEAVRRSVAGRPRPAVVYVIGLDPTTVAGPNVFIGELLEVAGGRNVFADVTASSPQMSLEEIVRRRPELVLMPAPGNGAAAIARLRRAPGWRELIDSGSTRVELVDADLLHRPGAAIGRAAEALRDAIHGVPDEPR
jgi:iron complex transport system substrate-binding protein